MQFNFEKLIIYQRSLEYIDFAYNLTEQFPSVEQFSLTNQFRRAAVSISLNIGEGSAGTKKEFMNFLRISNRSVRECVVCTSIAFRRKYISAEDQERSRQMLLEIARMNSGLISSLRDPGDYRKSSTNHEPNSQN